MQVSWEGGLAALAKKGLDEHTLTFDSHEPRKSAFRSKKKPRRSLFFLKQWSTWLFLLAETLIYVACESQTSMCVYPILFLQAQQAHPTH